MKKSTHNLLLTMAAALLIGSGAARAEDTDVYVDNAGTTGLPNVLLVLDNAANFESSATNTCRYVDDGLAPSLGNTAGGIEQCAIFNVVSGLAEESVNIGLMVYESANVRDREGVNCGNANGGCLVQPLIKMTADKKATFLAWIKTWRTTGGAGSGYIKSNTERTGAAMQEAWAYYKGSTGLSGRNYAGVQPTAGCQKNFVIFIGNAFSTSGTPGDGGSASVRDALVAAGASSAQLVNLTVRSESYGTAAFSCGTYSMGSHTDPSGLYADEWTRFMKQTDIFTGIDDNQGITTFTIGLLGASCKPDYPALLNSMAEVGGGLYYATTSYEEIVDALTKILNQVQAVNSVFASATLPVSVNAQGTYLNQIYLGMFRPDPYALPRWVGNLKQYQFMLRHLDPSNPDVNTATLVLADNSKPSPISAISNAGTGFIVPDAVSFWTYKDTAAEPDLSGGFYRNDPRGAGLGFDSPDGEQVDKGGVGQQIRKQVLTTNYASTPTGPRKVYTYCPSGAACAAALNDSSNAFATSNAALTDAVLGAQAGTSVSALTRAGTTATATTAVAHGFIAGDQVTLAGANQSEYNGIKTVVAVTATQFTFTVPDAPPSPATGSYTASVPGASVKSVTTITRVGATATATVVGHGFTTGNTVTVSGSNQSAYNNDFVITWVNADTFTFTVVESPISPAGSGTATVGGTVANIAAIGANPNDGVVRASGSTTVTVSTTANHGFANTGQVTLSGIMDASGNLIAEYNVGPVAYTKTGNKAFTFTLPAPTSPVSPATGTMSAQLSSSKALASLTRSGTTATATTVAAAHGFAAGATVSIGGTTATNEGAYTGNHVIALGTTADKFTYQVVLSPVSPATGTISVSKAGTSDRVSLINWVRGQDNYGDEPGPGGAVTVRPSVHGDVLHSRPVVINYGDARGTVVFYGANDGNFRAINGSQTAALTNWDGAAVPAGGELWSLILPDHYGKLNRQRVNTPELRFPSTILARAQTKDYFVDGPTGSYQKLRYQQTGGVDDPTKPQVVDKAYLFLTMRRGGRFIYAIDVTTPNSPQVLWKIDQNTAGFSELGQTWSRPRLTQLNSYLDGAGKPIPVLIFGAGYDVAQDSEPPAANTMGRGIFVINAETGALVWSANPSCASGTTCLNVAGMVAAIPSDIAFIDRDNDGRTDKLYFGDTAGNLWRADVSATLRSAWTVTKLAALGCSTGVCAAGTAPRKFFFPPAVILVGGTGAVGSYDAVMLASGDREHPLLNTAVNSAYNVTNRIYFVKDTGTTVGTPATSNVVESGGLFDATSTLYNDSVNGYFITFALGEKSVNAAITVFGTTYLGTNRPKTPSATSCAANLGEAKGYAINPFTGSYTDNIFDGGGLPPSPVAGLVGIDLADGSTIMKKFCIGCAGAEGTPGGAGEPTACNSALQNCLPNKAIPASLRRTYWYTK